MDTAAKSLRSIVRWQHLVSASHNNLTVCRSDDTRIWLSTIIAFGSFNANWWMRNQATANGLFLKVKLYVSIDSLNVFFPFPRKESVAEVKRV